MHYARFGLSDAASIFILRCNRLRPWEGSFFPFFPSAHRIFMDVTYAAGKRSRQIPLQLRLLNIVETFHLSVRNLRVLRSSLLGELLHPSSRNVIDACSFFNTGPSLGPTVYKLIRVTTFLLRVQSKPDSSTYRCDLPSLDRKIPILVSMVLTLLCVKKSKPFC